MLIELPVVESGLKVNRLINSDYIIEVQDNGPVLIGEVPNNPSIKVTEVAGVERVVAMAYTDFKELAIQVQIAYTYNTGTIDV